MHGEEVSLISRDHIASKRRNALVMITGCAFTASVVGIAALVSASSSSADVSIFVQQKGLGAAALRTGQRRQELLYDSITLVSLS